MRYFFQGKFRAGEKFFFPAILMGKHQCFSNFQVNSKPCCVGAVDHILLDVGNCFKMVKATDSAHLFLIYMDHLKAFRGFACVFSDYVKEHVSFHSPKYMNYSSLGIIVILSSAHHTK